MSILYQPDALRRRTDPLPAALWFALYVVVVIAGGALLGAFLVRLGLNADSGFWHDFVERHGGARITRRVQTGVAVLLGPWLLGKIGWRGFHDLGWESQRSGATRLRDLFRGMGLGFGVMGILFGLALTLGAREWDPEPNRPWILSIFVGFLVTGLGVGIIEETLTRGVLYRSMARCWTPWTGAGVSSAVFAYAHFLKPTPESFEAGLFAVLGSSLFDEMQNPHVPLKFLNMFLFGLALCRFVQRRGDIWYATGIHAAAVGLIKFVSDQTRIVGDRIPWFGHSAKFDDGWLLTLLLLGILVGVEAFKSPPDTTLHVKI